MDRHDLTGAWIGPDSAFCYALPAQPFEGGTSTQGSHRAAVGRGSQPLPIEPLPAHWDGEMLGGAAREISPQRNQARPRVGYVAGAQPRP